MTDTALARELHLAPGLSTVIARPDRFTPERHLPIIAQAGFKCIELGTFTGSDDFPWDRPDEVRELVRIAADTGVRIWSVHAPNNWAEAPDAIGRGRALDVHKCFADLAAELGAEVVVVHLWLNQIETMEREAEEALLREALDELSEHVLAMPCCFGWENSARGLTTAEHCEWIRALSPSAFGLVLDNGHSYCAGSTDEYLALAAERLCSLHLHDNDGSYDSHLIPGEGTFPWEEFGPKLLRTGYTGPLMLEMVCRKRQHDLPVALAEARAAISRMGLGV